MGTRKGKKKTQTPPDPLHEPLEVVAARFGRPVEGFNEGTSSEPRENLVTWATTIPDPGLLDRDRGGAVDLWRAIRNAGRARDLTRQLLDIVQDIGFKNSRTQNGGWLVVASAQMAEAAVRLHVSSSPFTRLGVMSLARMSLEAAASSAHILVGTKDESTSWEDSPRATTAKTRCASLSSILRLRTSDAPDAYTVYDHVCEHTHMRYGALQSVPNDEETYVVLAFVCWAAAVVAERATGIDMAVWPEGLPSPLPWEGGS